jgi:NAD(P)H-dependent FMN reductase
MKILAISGSLRRNSYNSYLVRISQELAPIGLEIESFEISEIPFFNQDLESDIPKSVEELRSKLSKSDGLLIATPEYNNMIPGVLKNTLEWISRGNEAKNKPVAIMGASDGGFGTVRAQNQLLLLTSILGMRNSGSLRLPISNVDDLINEKGELRDPNTREKIKNLLIDFMNFIDA